MNTAHDGYPHRREKTDPDPCVRDVDILSLYEAREKQQNIILET
jgi:hypothetical protein